MPSSSKEAYLCEACGRAARGRHKLQRLQKFKTFACTLGKGQYKSARVQYLWARFLLRLFLISFCFFLPPSLLSFFLLFLFLCWFLSFLHPFFSCFIPLFPSIPWCLSFSSLLPSLPMLWTLLPWRSILLLQAQRVPWKWQVHSSAWTARWKHLLILCSDLLVVGLLVELVSYLSGIRISLALIKLGATVK